MRDRLVPAALLAASAGVLALAFPRASWESGAWYALAPLLVVALVTTPRAAFAWGWFHGTVFFLVLLRWLDFTFRTFSEIPWPLTWGPTFLLAAWCGLFVAIVSGLVAWLGRRRSPAWALATAPCLWVGAEWLRGHLLGGFPWGTLGYSQYLRLPVIQVAELGGVHGEGDDQVPAAAGRDGGESGAGEQGRGDDRGERGEGQCRPLRTGTDV